MTRPGGVEINPRGRRAIPQTGMPSVADVSRAHLLRAGYAICHRIPRDGGVKIDNIREIADAGADMMVAGSAIFGSDDYAATIAAMRAEIA